MSLVPVLRPRLALAAGLAVVPLMAFVPPGVAAESCSSPGANSNVCVSVTDTPDPVAPDGAGGSNGAGENNTSYLYTTVVRNAGRNTASHVGMSQTVPTSVVSVASAAGPCAVDGASVSCSFGSLPRNASATVEITVTAPTQTGLVLSTATASFAERGNDKPGTDPKIDTVTVTEPTDVTASAGETWVVPGQDTIVNSDPARPYRGRATIDGESTDELTRGFLASLNPVADENAPAFNCVLGEVNLPDGVFACRDGGWLLANIRRPDGEKFTPPLRFHLAWDLSVSLLQTEQTFVVFYAETKETPIERFGPCSSTNSPPCYENPDRSPEGVWSADLISPRNGYMR